MALHTHFTTLSIVVLALCLMQPLLLPKSYSSEMLVSAQTSDQELLALAVNYDYLEAEFYLFGSTGLGLDFYGPGLANGGPSPIGGRMAAFLDPLTKDIFFQFGLQKIGHLRAIRSSLGDQAQFSSRPLLNLSDNLFAQIMNDAFGRTLRPPFNPYANTINFLIASYVIPYVGVTGLVGTISSVQSPNITQQLAGILAIESGQDAIIRAMLYERRNLPVFPYTINVAEFTNRISMLRNQLGRSGLKDEGLVVPRELGAEGRVEGNILSADNNSITYGRSGQEVLKIAYVTGNESIPGGFFPNGANGRIARSFIN
ncbi:desiccation-related protein PCC13-62-like [Senna tora]|uniref:Desiccation-related protein PCC13-62-like n=1 Tax=Senna tora TaxID=362788 RepID=A0A834SLQ8_9FABA|nr:desiccation-related protein PCC13-62-like [Senna tora]